MILASSSPRRQELLSGAGYEFEVLTAEVTEHTGPHFSLRELTTANATAKAFAVVRKRTDAIILAADTLVSIEGEVIGKPANIEDATAILRRLRGRVHDVCTAVFIIGPRGRLVSFAEISRVKFRRLNDDAIDDYIRRINPLDKAGAYAAQDRAGRIIESIEGSATNVIGLPMEQTIQALRQFGISPACDRHERNYGASTATSRDATETCAGSRRNTR